MFAINAQMAAEPIVAGAILAIVGLIIVAYYSNVDSEERTFPQRPRRTPSRRTSPRKRQSRDQMKQIAVKKNGEVKLYRINTYGEIFED